MADESKQLETFNKDIELWERKLQVVERATRIRTEDFEGLYEENNQKIHNLKQDIQEFQGKLKFVKALEQEKVLQPSSSEVKSGKINAANIQDAIEYQKQKCFEQAKELDLLRHEHIAKRKQLAQKKKQCRQLRKMCCSIQKAGNSAMKNTKVTNKRIKDLETQYAAIKMKRKEDLYVSMKYEEIMDLLLEDANHYEKQLNEMKKQMKIQGINMKYLNDAKELALLAKRMQQEQLKLIQKKIIEDTHKQQRKLVKYKKKLSKLENKERKHQEEAEKKSPNFHEKSKTQMDQAEIENLKAHVQSVQQISKSTGISSLTELEDRIKNQKTTHSKLKDLCKNNELGLEKLKEREKELKARIENQATTQETLVDRSLLSKLTEMEETIKETEAENSLKEAEVNKFSLMLEKARMSVERIMQLLYSALGENSLHNVGKLSVKSILEMCENKVESLLQSYDKLKVNGLKKQPHLKVIQSKPKILINPGIKISQEAQAVENSSDDDENNRILIKQQSQMFVEAHTRHKSNRRQILRL